MESILVIAGAIRNFEITQSREQRNAERDQRSRNGRHRTPAPARSARFQHRIHQDGDGAARDPAGSRRFLFFPWPAGGNLRYRLHHSRSGHLPGIIRSRRRTGPADHLYRRDEPIPPAVQRFDEPRVAGVIPQRLAQLLHRRVQPMFEIHEGVARPELLLQFFPSHDLARMLEQHRQHFKRLAGQFERQSLFAQFLGMKVNFEDTKADCR
jgi:hypothetical protein